MTWTRLETQSVDGKGKATGVAKWFRLMPTDWSLGKSGFIQASRIAPGMLMPEAESALGRPLGSHFMEVKASVCLPRLPVSSRAVVRRTLPGEERSS